MARRAEWKPVRPRPETPRERRRRRWEETGLAVQRNLFAAVVFSPGVAFVGVGLAIGWCQGFVAFLTPVIASRPPEFDDRPLEGRRASFSFRVGDARSENSGSGLRTIFPDGQELVLWPLSVRDLPPDAQPRRLRLQTLRVYSVFPCLRGSSIILRIDRLPLSQ